MEPCMTAIDAADNGGRRQSKDRRFLVSAPAEQERRTRWERRSGYDRRMRRVVGISDDRRIATEISCEHP
jgi:hypothetical protein